MTAWLIGNRGMLGQEVERILSEGRIDYLATDQDVDIGDMDSLRAFAEGVAARPVEWVINCSGYTAVDQAEQEPGLAYRINADGARNAALIAKDLGASLIHISTDYVFNGTSTEPYSEDDPPDPTCVYGKSKLEGERQVRECWERHFVLRTAWLYGAHGKNFVDTMLRLFRERGAVKVVEDQRGSPTYARDLAAVIVRIVRDRRREYGTYHYTNEGQTSWYEFAREIYRLGREVGACPPSVRIDPVSTAEYPTAARRPQYSYLSKDKIRRVLGEKIRSWQDALREFLEESGGRL